MPYHDGMMHSGEPLKTTLTIRNVDGSLKELLRIRAAKNGRSMEAELRHILQEAVIGPVRRPNLAEMIHNRFAQIDLDELPCHPEITTPEPINFD